MKNIIILGSTGSIGTQTLDVIDRINEQWNVIGLSAYSNYKLLAEQSKKYNPDFVVLGEEKYAGLFSSNCSNKNTTVDYGAAALNNLAAVNADLIINSIVGAAGLKPSISCLKAGNLLGLANKESLVIGGEIIYSLVGDNNNRILPIDSEHNALFQILRGRNRDEIKSLYLTASGGPFREKPLSEFKNITVADALNHPNWDMGKKISIDSATMMNKGLEVIEAHWLFAQPYEQIKVVIHPQSIIHSLVEFKDNSFLAELGAADMRNPIQNVITFPDNSPGVGEKLDLYSLNKLSFYRPDYDKFRALRLAYRAGEEGGSMPAVLNAANEAAVKAFLARKIGFEQIPILVEEILEQHKSISAPGLEDLSAADSWARKQVEEAVEC